MTAVAFALCAFVLNALWQSTAIVLLVWAALHFVPRANATTRCLVWLGALVAGLLLPLLTSNLLVRAAPLPTRSVASSQAAGASVSIPTKVSTASRGFSPATPLPRTRVTLAPWFAATVALAWFAGAAFLLVRLGASLIYLERLKREALPFPVELRERLSRWNAAMKGSREVRLCVSDSLGVPVAIGIFDALILVPRDLVELEPSEIDCVLLHELAHLRRGDDWINALQRAIAALLFFSPAIGYACSRLDVEREVACDDAVLRNVPDPLRYAGCLARMTEAAAWPARAVAAPGIFSTRRGMSLRIERLLDSRRDSRVRMVGVPLVVGAIAIGAACLLGAYGAPSFATAPTVQIDAMRVSDEPSGLLQLSYAGNWKTEAPVRDGSVNFELSYPTTMSNAGGPVPLEELGLTAAALGGVEHAIEFRVKTDAGTFVCRGNVADGDGKGTFTFVPDASYAAAYDARRSRRLSPQQQVQAGMFDLSTAYIDAAADAGFGEASFSDLLGFKIFGVTADFLRMLRSDFPTADASEVVGARMVSDKDHIDLHALHLDFPKDDLDAILAVAGAGVTPAYVAALRAAEVKGLNANSVAVLRAHGIDQAFADGLAAKGPHGLSVDEVVQLKNRTP